MLHKFHRWQDYQHYLVCRLVAEMKLADQAASNFERSIHMQACRYYCDLLEAAEAEQATRRPAE